MAEHYPRSTVSISAFCKRCSKYTQHRVDDGLKGPCLECVAKLEREHAAKAKPAVQDEKQLTFFGGEVTNRRIQKVPERRAVSIRISANCARGDCGKCANLGCTHDCHPPSARLVRSAA